MTGCTKTSAGCANCYAERIAHRLQRMGVAKYRHGFQVTVHPDVVKRPLKWRQPRMVFVSSMGDLFHDEVPLGFVNDVFAVMKAASHHQFLLLTKRSERLRKLAPALPWPKNIWMGVTVEDRRAKSRIDDLMDTPARIKWLSMEPLLESPGRLDLDGIDWVVVGGESGPGARTMHETWVLDIQSQCRTAQAAFYFKQWGGVDKEKTGRLLKGQLVTAMPKIESAQPELLL
jgi:protein gp37